MESDLVVMLFTHVLITSVKASLLILFIMFFRSTWGNKINFNIVYVIWLLLVVRLMIPVDITIFRFEQSFYPMNIPVLTAAPVGIPPAAIATDLIPVDPGNAVFPVEIISWIWFFVLILLVVKRLVFYAVFLQKLKKEKRVSNHDLLLILDECRRKISLKTNITLIETPLVKSPCASAVSGNSVLIPPGLPDSFNKKELSCIFTHELLHIKNFDLRIEWVCSLLKMIYWFNPLVRISMNLMQKDCEYRCDSRSISALGHENIIVYGRVLLKILGSIHSKTASQYSLGIGNHKNHIKRRLEMICTNKKRSFLFSFTIALFVLIIAGFSLTGIAFAESVDVKNMQVSFTKPMDNIVITSPFGSRISPFSQKEELHSGIDVTWRFLQPVKAAADGTVIEINANDVNLGNYVVIQHQNDFQTRYHGLSKLADIKKGDKITAGTVIGIMGNTMRLSTGPHLHFELLKAGKPVNPQDYITF